MMTEFYPGTRDSNEVIIHHHHHHHYNIPETLPQPYKQPQLYQFNTVEPDHRNHVRRDAYLGDPRSYTQQQHAHFYGNGAMPMRLSPSPLVYQMNSQPIYRNPHTYPMELFNSQIPNGENVRGTFKSTPRNKNSRKPAKQKENKHMRKVKTCCTTLLAPFLAIFPVIRALGSFLSRSTDVGTDVLFSTHICSITGTCDCVWAKRGAYGWPPWKGYQKWGPTACWQTCNNYQTLDISVNNATDEYPTHYCFAMENESTCSATPSSTGLVHPLWCYSSITFIVIPLLIVNCLYIYKARHLKIFKKIPALLFLLGIIPIFHFVWPVSYILQPILGECADLCHSITITTRIVGAIFESVPQFCLQNFAIMQTTFGDVIGIDKTSTMVYISVISSLCSIAYAVSCFMGKGKMDKVVKFIATFITVGVRVTVNSMYGRHTFGPWMYALPMTSAFLFICICNFLYGIFCCKCIKKQPNESTLEIKRNQSNATRIDPHFEEGELYMESSSKVSQTSDDHNIFSDTWKTLGMYVISATCDGFSVNGLLAWIAFMPWAIWPFQDNMTNFGMAEPGFTISVSVLSCACAGLLLNIVILICNRWKT